jgi:hypothetical protein
VEQWVLEAQQVEQGVEAVAVAQIPLLPQTLQDQLVALEVPVDQIKMTVIMHQRRQLQSQVLVVAEVAVAVEAQEKLRQVQTVVAELLVPMVQMGKSSFNGLNKCLN